MSLRLCSGCSRHVREEQCPFCGAEDSVPIPPPARPRVARIALVTAIGAAAVATATACGSTVAAYGGPPDSGANDASAQDAGQDATATFYGGPPIDSGID